MMIQSTTNNHLSIINNHLAFCPLHLSRTLYKSAHFMQNKPNFHRSQMNVNSLLTKDYEDIPCLRTPGKQTQTNPTCRGVASGEAGSDPISKQLQSPIVPGHLLINRMNRICCVYGLNVSFDSAKMALYTDNLEFEKTAVKKLNLLKHKRLNKLSWRSTSTGTLFAHSNSRNFLYTDEKQ